jgi:hypothetical protein
MQRERMSTNGLGPNVSKASEGHKVTLESKERLADQFFNLEQSDLPEREKIIQFGLYLTKNEKMTRPGNLICNGATKEGGHGAINSLTQMLSLTQLDIYTYNYPRNRSNATALVLRQIFDHILNDKSIKERIEREQHQDPVEKEKFDEVGTKIIGFSRELIRKSGMSDKDDAILFKILRNLSEDKEK